MLMLSHMIKKKHTYTTHPSTILYTHTDNNIMKKWAFLNQACAGLWPVHHWVFEIAFVCDVSMCVCVSLPQEHLHEWTLYNQLNKF